MNLLLLRQTPETVNKRSTRNKLRFQMGEALKNIREGQNHLGLIAALADDRSDYIDDNLPIIMATLEATIEALEAFDQGL